MRQTRIAALATLVLGLLVGCQGGNADLPKEKDKELRNNFSRALTPEEQAMMGKSSTEGAGRPQRTKG